MQQLAITQLAQAAYARSPIPQVPVSQFRVLGGSVYAGQSDLGKTWKGEHMFMPRASMAYKLGERTVVKAGYGLFFDTLNAADYPNGSINQLGYTSATTNVAEHGLRTDLAPGRSAGTAFCRSSIRSRSRNGTRFEPALADSLGPTPFSGSGVHPRKSEPQARARQPLESRRAARAVRQHVG